MWILYFRKKGKNVENSIEIQGKYGKMDIDNKGGQNMSKDRSKEDKKILTIIKEDGTKEEVELIVCFEFNDTKKEYAVYTRNETDENGNIMIYVSRIDRSEDTPKMGAIDSEEEWNRIKDVLRELSKND